MDLMEPISDNCWITQYAHIKNAYMNNKGQLIVEWGDALRKLLDRAIPLIKTAHDIAIPHYLKGGTVEADDISKCKACVWLRDVQHNPHGDEQP